MNGTIEAEAAAAAADVHVNGHHHGQNGEHPVPARPAVKPKRRRFETGLYAHVTGWGFEVPDRIMTNDDLAQIVETSDEWIASRTGIRQRHIADPKENAATLGFKAARKALTRADVLPQDIDLIIVATSSPVYLFPSTANLIQDWLGATKAGGFDLLAACTGFIYGLGMASAQIKAGYIETALVIGTETMSRIVDWNDRSTCVLFGDGAGAFVLTASDVPGGVHAVQLHSDGSGGDLLYAYSGIRPSWDGQVSSQEIKMNGREVFRFGTRALVDVTKEVVDQAGLTMADVDLIVPHQANMRIIQSAAKSMGLPEEKFFTNIAEYGNTSAASIPLAMVEAIEQGKVKPNDKIVLVGFGAGLSWGAALVEWDVEPAPRQHLREFVREGWYILARARSMLLRLRRWFQALMLRGSKHEARTPKPKSD